MQEHIFKPLGISDVTMFPNEKMISNLAYMHQRDPVTGALSERDHLYRRSFLQNTKEKQQKFFQSAGAGLFAKPKEYLKVLTALLNEGVSPTTGNRILKKETVDMMFENEIPNQPDFARGGPPAADSVLSNSLPEMYPQAGKPPQGWGLSMFLTLSPGETGRGANTGWWCGLSNLFWWVDREKGVTGILCECRCLTSSTLFTKLMQRVKSCLLAILKSSKHGLRWRRQSMTDWSKRNFRIQSSYLQLVSKFDQLTEEKCNDPSCNCERYAAPSPTSYRQREVGHICRLARVELESECSRLSCASHSIQHSCLQDDVVRVPIPLP
jgi:hypothetical protein